MRRRLPVHGGPCTSALAHLIEWRRSGCLERASSLPLRRPSARVDVVRRRYRDGRFPQLSEAASPAAATPSLLVQLGRLD
jgi:hypothetical protein